MKWGGKEINKAFFYLCINDKNQGTTTTKYFHSIKSSIKEIDMAWQIPHLELYKGTVWNVYKDMQNKKKVLINMYPVFSKYIFSVYMPYL